MMQLDLLRARADDTDKALRYRKQFYEVLSDGAWHLRKEVCKLIPQLSDRACRQIAENSKGQVLSGQLGYKLTKFATNEEIDHAERWLLSQARHMTERAVQIRKCRNSGGVAA